LASFEEPSERDVLWQRVWRNRVVDIAILLGMLGVLTLMFFFQDQLVRRPKLTAWLRYGFLTAVLFWLGFYANAQLSVINVLTFSNALVTDFSWTYFLMDPLVFILWFAVAAGLLFWGRGAFCGWLCPFGALQELTNHIGRRFGIPQVTVPWGLNERLWPVKYIIFLGLFGMSLYSLSWAEKLAEVEPFKTAIILNFMRAWPFVAFAAGLIVVNLFVERFFCRYMCPLGAALAIPARIRMFDWLKRHKECGNPCQICAHDCPVDAIHPTGEINVNECIYCLECQKLYYDDQRCPHMIQRRIKREKRLVNTSDEMLSAEQLAEKRRLESREKLKKQRQAKRRQPVDVDA
jgi:NosR/NirI family nitrous oxide reductase transcriptional regulator